MNVGLRLTMSAEARTRMNFSIQHLFAASHFSKQVATVEYAHAEEAFGAFFEEILWLSSACVLLCVAALEAYANELFVDRAQHFPDLRSDIADKLWELYEQKPTLEKFDMALYIKQKPPLERGSRPTQDVADLIILRNGLTHFKPEWDNEQVEHAKISKRLADRFVASPFLTDQEPIFPRRWATAGCTRWAVESAVSFLQDFEISAGLPPKIMKFAERFERDVAESG
jgi:hypothetical protein